MTYVSLHNHSTYSILDGHGFPSSIALRAAELGAPALAITDHGNLFGAFAHFEACKAAGIKPVIGMEAYLSPQGMDSRERPEWGTIEEDGKPKSLPGLTKPYTHLTVLAQNAAGLRNLYKLHSMSYLRGHHYKPRFDFEALAEHSEGLIVLSGCVGSELSMRIRLGQRNEAFEVAERFKSVFGDRYFFEVMQHGLEFDNVINRQLYLMANELDIQIVATGDSHFVREGDAPVHDAMLCIGTGALLSDEKRMRFPGSGYHLMGTEDMLKLHPDGPVHRSGEIAESVTSYDEVFSHRDLMPKGDPKELHDKAWAGFRDRFKDLDFDDRLYHEDRMDYELRVITELGFAGYCLALDDIVGFAKREGIFVGNGRGSGAASLVLYCLRVTNVDPMQHDLLFERFLNYERSSPPDVDLDFESARRDEVFTYATERYGSAFTSRILTLGTEKTRRAILDAAKVLGRSPQDAAKIKNLIPPDRRGRTLALSDVKGLEEADPEVFKLAKGIDGQIRQPGIHPGGFIISSESLEDVLPVKQGPSDPGLVSGFTMGEVERLGLIKFDFLGITNLDIIKRTLEFIESKPE